MNLFDPKRILMAPLANDDGSGAAGGEDDAGDRGDDFVADSADGSDDAGKKSAAADKADDDAGKKSDDAGKKDVSIPKARFDEAVAKERTKVAAAEARAKELEAKLKVQEDTEDVEKTNKEIEALEEQLDQAIADGDKDKKASIRAQIRAKTQALADSSAEKRAQYATLVAVERVRYDAQVGLLEAANPQMNPDSDQFDAELTGELLELKSAYEAAGMGSTEALKKAAKYVFKTAPAEVKKDEPKKDAPSDEDKQAAAEKAAQLKEEAIKRGLKAKGQQPAADADKVGKASDSAGKRAEDLKPSRMSAKEFDKLTEEQKAVLRGDSL